jgi:hypothetical protein
LEDRRVLSASTAVLLSIASPAATTAAPLVSGPTETLVASVTSPAGGITATSGSVTTRVTEGQVQFMDNGQALGAPVMIGATTASSGLATLTLPSGGLALVQGLNRLTAVYSDPVGGKFAGSTSNEVDQATTTTALSVSANPVVSGQQFLLAANVASTVVGMGQPSGAVDFVVDGKLVGAAPASAAVLSWVFTSSGSHTIQADYLGSSSFAPSPSNTISEVVNRATSVINVAAPTTQVYGQPLSLAISIAAQPPGSALPTAPLTVTVDSDPPVTVPLNKPGSASYTVPVSELGAGAHTIVVSYPGDSNLAPSSTTLDETITPATPQTALSVSPQTSLLGKSVTLTAIVGLAQTSAAGLSTTGQAAVPTGTVNFYDGATLLNSTPVTTSTTSTTGPATFTFSTALPILGWQYITAVFTSSGSNAADYTNSTSQAVLVDVVAASTTGSPTTGLSTTAPKATATANDLALMVLMNE